MPSPPPAKLASSESPKRRPSTEPAGLITSNTTIETDDASEVEGEEGYYTDGVSTGSTSISSSIRAHTFEDGIRYHKFHDGKYAFPNDETEQNRDDMKHAMTLMLSGERLHLAPIDPSPQNIIDLGTGTGIWAIDMADQYSSAHVIGVDLSPIQPAWVPPNLRFVVDDIEEEWVYPRNHFDYIHVRHTLHSIRNPVGFMERAYQHAKPGGWVEFQELHYYPHCDDDSMNRPYPFRTFLEHVRDGIANFGSDLNGITKLRAQMEAAGFVNIHEEMLKAPIGIWPKHKTLKLAGLYLRTAIFDGLMNIAKRPLEKGLGWSLPEIELLLVDVRKSLMDPSIHSYMPLHMLYGQKPTTEEA